MDILIKSSIITLNKAKVLLSILSDNEFNDITIGPYYSSIGSHLRHILDFYNCALCPNFENKIDLTNRSRDIGVETKCNIALQYLDTIILKLETLESISKENLIVIDDLGLGKIEMNYTFDALIAQANSHAIHHYAIINFILERLDISIDDETFGYNATTPKSKINLS